MADHVKTVPVDEKGIVPLGTPTQVANPSRASWRSFVQAAIAFLIAVNAAAPAAYAWITGPDGNELARAFLGQWYGPIVLGLNVVVVAAAFLTKLAAYLMANKTVNAWISKYLPWLAPIPLKPLPAPGEPDAPAAGV